MSPEKLIRMANQIATFYESQPEETRVSGVATHLSDFWDPRMRRELLALLADDPGPFHELVREAAQEIRAPSL